MIRQLSDTHLTSLLSSLKTTIGSEIMENGDTFVQIFITASCLTCTPFELIALRDGV